MTNELFDQQDKSLMERLKAVREQKVPPAIMKGFSASVEKRIREKQPSLEIQFKPKRSWVRAWVPVMTVLVIGSILVLRLPIGMRGMPVAPTNQTVELAQANSNQLTDEIAALTEVGAWTEEDEKSTGLPTENDIEDLELSRSIPSSDTRLA